jgi:nitric oxide reductase subunit B
MSAYLLMAVGLVSRKLAERAAYSALILIFLGGVLGTGRYWAGGPSMRVPRAACSRPRCARSLSENPS